MVMNMLHLLWIELDLAAFNQNDKALQIPIITPVSFEVGHVKEAIATEADVPEWGDNESRTIGMEVSTAASVLSWWIKCSNTSSSRINENYKRFNKRFSVI